MNFELIINNIVKLNKKPLNEYIYDKLIDFIEDKNFNDILGNAIEINEVISHDNNLIIDTLFEFIESINFNEILENAKKLKPFLLKKNINIHIENMLINAIKYRNFSHFNRLLEVAKEIFSSTVTTKDMKIRLFERFFLFFSLYQNFKETDIIKKILEENTTIDKKKLTEFFEFILNRDMTNIEKICNDTIESTKNKEEEKDIIAKIIDEDYIKIAKELGFLYE